MQTDIVIADLLSIRSGYVRYSGLLSILIYDIV